MLGNPHMTIIVGTVNAANEVKIPFEREGDLGDRWLQKSVTLNAAGNGDDKRYMVAICGWRAADKNDIAVDDISFADGACKDGSKRDEGSDGSNTEISEEMEESLFKEIKAEKRKEENLFKKGKERATSGRLEE